MQTHDILESLRARDAKIITTIDRRVSLASHLVRFVDADGPGIAVGGEIDEVSRITGLLDAIHWARADAAEQDSLRFVLGSGEGHARVVGAIARLLESQKRGMTITVDVDFEPTTLSATTLADSLGATVDEAATPASPIAEALSNAANRPTFGWHRHGDAWAGCLDGFEICRIDEHVAILDVPGPSREQAIFREIAGDLVGPIGLGPDGKLEHHDQIATIIASADMERADGQFRGSDLEARLSARIMRGASNIPGLDPVVAHFDTRWTPEGPPRLADVIMRDGETPVVVELETSRGARLDESFRHAIAKAVLHRAFIVEARAAQSWFEQRGMRAAECRAAVAFAKLTSARSRGRLADLEAVAEMFGVEIIQVRGG